MARSDVFASLQPPRYLEAWQALGGNFRRRMARGGLRSGVYSTMVYWVEVSDDETSELQQMAMEVD